MRAIPSNMPTKKTTSKRSPSPKTLPKSGASGKAATSTAPHDSIAENRRLAVVPAASIPKVPTGFVSTPSEERLRRLSHPAEALRAELLVALDEVIARKASYRSELGDLAPDPVQAEALRPRLGTLRESVEAVDALSACLHELEEIALSDAAEFVQGVTDEVVHRQAKKPSLATAYARVLHIAEQRRQLITEGIARAKDKKDGGPPTS